jgi:hypothetical protein
VEQRLLECRGTGHAWPDRSAEVRDLGHTDACLRCETTRRVELQEGAKVWVYAYPLGYSPLSPTDLLDRRTYVRHTRTIRSPLGGFAVTVRRLLCLLAAAALLGACGSDDDSGQAAATTAVTSTTIAPTTSAAATTTAATGSTYALRGMTITLRPE